MLLFDFNRLFLLTTNLIIMKKILLLLVAMSALTACEESTSTNKIVMQGRINNSFWKSVNVTAIKDANGNLTLTGLNGYDQLELKTSSAGVGTYNLGTNNANNSATYNFFADEAIYKTSVFASPVNQIKLVSSGSGYLDVTSAATIGGSGSGLRVNIKADLVTGAVTEIEVNAPGNSKRK